MEKKQKFRRRIVKGELLKKRERKMLKKILVRN